MPPHRVRHELRDRASFLRGFFHNPQPPLHCPIPSCEQPWVWCGECDNIGHPVWHKQAGNEEPFFLLKGVNHCHIMRNRELMRNYFCYQRHPSKFGDLILTPCSRDDLEISYVVRRNMPPWLRYDQGLG